MSPPTIPRLPLAPLLPYLQPEIDAINERNRRPGVHGGPLAGPPAALEALLGCARRKAQRITTDGQIREDDADHIAIRLGLHPALIWGNDWWDLAREAAA